MRRFWMATWWWVLSSGVAHGQRVSPEIGLELFLDGGVGSDPMLEIEYSDGSDQTINGGFGGGLRVGAGARFSEPGSHQLELLGNLGFKYSSMRKVENAGLDFSRFPLELLAFYRNDSAFLRLGGGIVHHRAISLSGSGAVSDLQVDFENATGPVVQFDIVHEFWNFGLRYAWIDYIPEGTGVDIASNFLGVHVGAYYDRASATKRASTRDPAAHDQTFSYSRSRSPGHSFCETDGDCPNGLICAATNGGRACWVHPPCSSDVDCRVGSRCTSIGDRRGCVGASRPPKAAPSPSASTDSNATPQSDPEPGASQERPCMLDTDCPPGRLCVGFGAKRHCKRVP